MAPLPTANKEIAQFFRQSLETFAGYVREVDYASARPLFHPDVLPSGLRNDVVSGIDKWVATQWDNVWPKTSDFRFVLEQTSVLALPDGRMATVIAPWTSTGYHPVAARFRDLAGHPVFFGGCRWSDVYALPYVAQPRRAAGEPCQWTGEGLRAFHKSSRPASRQPFGKRPPWACLAASAGNILSHCPAAMLPGSTTSLAKAGENEKAAN